MENEKLGTENIKIVLDELFDTSTKVYAALEDGFQWMEDSWVLFQEGKDIPVIIAKSKAAYKEVLDLDAQEHQEIADWAQDRWNIPESQIDEKIEEAIQITAKIHLWAENGISIFKEIKAWKDSLAA